jgi:Pregnancy-associated plasma protein-A
MVSTGLLHVFENGCAFPGDGIHDTPYQEELADSDVISCDQPTDTCPGWPGNAPIENIMGYVNKCYASFSEQQIDLMHVVYEKYRLSRPEFCYMDLFITFNANPEAISIHLASDSIYYKTIEGSEYTPNQSVVIPAELDHGRGVSNDGSIVAL